MVAVDTELEASEYDALVRLALERGCSIDDIVRDAVAAWLLNAEL